MKKSTWSTVSASNHTVATDGTVWRKTPLLGSYAHLERECAVNEALGRVSFLEDGSLFTEHLGNSPSFTVHDVDLSMVLTMTDEMSTCHRTLNLPPLDTLNGWTERNRASIVRRLGEKHPLAQIALRITEQEMPITDEPWGLCHTDPHLGNWVEDDGHPVLLDWESALLAPFDVDLASFATVFFYAGRMDVVDALVDMSVDTEFFWWAARVKAALNLSFVAVKHGEEAGWDRCLELEDLVAYSS